MKKANLHRVVRHEDFTFYRRGKVWYYKCYNREGKLLCGHSTRCKSRTAAQKYCEELKRQGLIYTHSNKSFRAYASHFFDDDGLYLRYAKASGHEYSRSYIRKLQSVTKRYLIPAFGDRPLNGITMNDVKSALFDLKEKRKLSNKTLNDILSIFRIIITDVMNNGLIFLSPINGIKSFARNPRPRNAFELADAVLILHSDFSSEKIRIYLLVAALTGMRVSEILAIRKETLHKTYIEVKDQIQNKTLRPTKTKTTRIVPIIPELYAILHGMIGNDFVFEGIREGVPSNELRKLLKKLMPEKRLAQGYCLHSFRHFCNTQMLSENISPVKVAAVLGHSIGTVSQIQKAYTNFTETDFSEVYEFQKKYFHLLND